MSDDGTPLAAVLHDNVPYVRGWADARDAAGELAEELRALGLEDAFVYMKADVNMFGNGFVRLERISASAATAFVRALVRGLCEEMAREAVSADPADGAASAA